MYNYFFRIILLHVNGVQASCMLSLQVLVKCQGLVEGELIHSCGGVTEAEC